MAETPLVALVGRPNVGKSTLFNRIIERRLAVVHDRPGTTRDRQEAEAEWGGVRFTLVDTGGIEAYETLAAGGEPLAEDSVQFIEEMREQAELAIHTADVIILVVDVTTGITAADQEVSDMLRRSDKPVLVAANKGDHVDRHVEAMEFYSLGLGEVFPISALHGTGVGDLLDAVIEALPHHPPETFEEEEDVLKVAIVGRPNVGKSSLLNRLLGEQRVIVSPVAGTTRDLIDTRITWQGQPVILIDTAGIRRRGRIERTVERWSVLRALKAIKRADVALLLIDATDGVTAQDTHVAGYILDELKSVVVLVNKWDAIEKDTYTINEYTEHVRERLKFIPYAPVLFISALTGQRTHTIMPMVERVWEERYHRIPTSELNRMVREAVLQQPPPSKGGRQLKIRYASQVAVAPPKFVFHVNDPELMHFSYQRYLENRIRELFPFTGTPLLMDFRASSEDRPRGKRGRR